MKKNYVFILTLLFSAIIYGQTTIFNQTVDNKWSTAGNWTAGIPVDGDGNTKVSLGADVELDADYAYDKITIGAVNITGNGTLTLTGGVATSGLLVNNDPGITFNANLVVDATIVKNLQVNGVNRTLTFGSSSTLTLNSVALAKAAKVGSKVVFQGVLNGSGDLILTALETIFDAGSNNTAFTGDFLLGLNLTTANTTGDGAFLAAGSSLQTYGVAGTTGGTLTIKGADSCHADVSVQLDHLYTIDFDANQGFLGTLEIAETGVLTIDKAAGVNLSFADSFAIPWGTGSVVITGFETGTISFGTDANGLTAQQLSQITVTSDDVDFYTVSIDVDGFLQKDTLLSNKDFNALTFSVYPNPAQDVINIKTKSSSLSKVAIYDITGKQVLFTNKIIDNKIDVSHLNTGIYAIRLEDANNNVSTKKLVISQ